MDVRLLVLALVLSGCATATRPPAAPEPSAPMAMKAPHATAPAASRRHHVARRLSPPFLASSSLRHVAASDASAALVSADYDGAR